MSSREKMLSRRRLLGWTPALAAMAVSPSVKKAEAASVVDDKTEAIDYYNKLGVAKIINAAGTYTFLTAAVMPPQVRRAVELAAMHPVRLKDLQHASGEYLAKKLRCEAALVTSGASAALTLATAACIAAANGASPEEIPQNVGKMKNEVVVQKAHRYEYDHAMLLCGAQIREVETLEDYKRALGSKTVMTNFFNSAETDGNGPALIDRETWLKVAHEHGVPCHNDAAADMPPIENLWKYTGMGFDLVCFSGGKGIRGPQNAGLLLGKKQLIDLAMLNDSPNSAAVGRGMKVAKEQIVGMVAAVDWLLDQSDERNQAEYMRRVHIIEDAVKTVPTMKTKVVTPPIANHVPHLLMTYDAATVGITAQQAQEKLRAQTPSIELNPATVSGGRGFGAEGNTIIIATWMLQPGEAEIVARSLRSTLMKKEA